ncbi:MAG: helix-turn-helix transcriptional regulator [Isosphaeraceae bacterium]
MNSEKRRALEEAGFVFEDAEDFLELTAEERQLVELRVTVSRAVRDRRVSQKLTQQEVAARIHSSQSRVAKLESGSSDVSLDLMFKGFFALGGTMQDLRSLGQPASGKPRKAAEATSRTRVASKAMKTMKASKIPKTQTN